MAKKMEKTNVMRLLDQKKVPYESYCYIDAATTVGTEVAAVLGQDPNQVFKTLVTVGGKTKQNFVFVIPVKTPFEPSSSAGISSVLAASIPSRRERAIAFPAIKVVAVAAQVKTWEIVFVKFFIKNLAVNNNFYLL